MRFYCAVASFFLHKMVDLYLYSVDRSIKERARKINALAAIALLSINNVKAKAMLKSVFFIYPITASLRSLYLMKIIKKLPKNLNTDTKRMASAAPIYPTAKIKT